MSAIEVDASNEVPTIEEAAAVLRIVSDLLRRVRKVSVVMSSSAGVKHHCGPFHSPCPEGTSNTHAPLPGLLVGIPGTPSRSVSGCLDALVTRQGGLDTRIRRKYRWIRIFREGEGRVAGRDVVHGVHGGGSP